MRLCALFLAIAVLATGACSSVGRRDSTFVPASPGQLRVATPLPALGFWNGATPETVNGGFEYAIARELAQRFGLQLQIVDRPFQRIVDGDLADVDLALAQITLTPERARRLAFSVTYLAANMGILTPSGTHVPDLETARKLRWVVENATTEQMFLQSIVRPTATTLVTAGRNETVAALTGGQVDAALLDLPTALAMANDSAGRLAVPGQFVTDQQLAIALPHESANLEPVNTALRNLMHSGELRRLESEELVPLLGRDPATVPVVVARTLP